MADAMTRPLPEQRPPAGPDEFYVGYLPMPRSLLFHVRLFMPVVLWIAVGAAAIFSGSQADPGGGAWRTGRPQAFEGRWESSPYPLLRVPSSKLGQPFETLLLVETGKFGSSKRADLRDGALVRVSGWLIERDGRSMIEMEPGHDSMQRIINPAETDRDRLAPPIPKPVGAATLRGEIVDAKCYLGVMKPGHGKTHKECATLCIAGGIPPMFVTKSADGTPRYLLLTDSTGRKLDDRLLPFVADPVEISGSLVELGDLTLFQINPATIRRL